MTAQTLPRAPAPRNPGSCNFGTWRYRGILLAEVGDSVNAFLRGRWEGRGGVEYLLISFDFHGLVTGWARISSGSPKWGIVADVAGRQQPLPSDLGESLAIWGVWPQGRPGLGRNSSSWWWQVHFPSPFSHPESFCALVSPCAKRNAKSICNTYLVLESIIEYKNACICIYRDIYIYICVLYVVSGLVTIQTHILYVCIVLGTCSVLVTTEICHPDCGCSTLYQRCYDNFHLFIYLR